MADYIKVPIHIGGATDRHRIIELLTGQITVDYPDLGAATGGSATAAFQGLRPGMKIFLSPATGGMVLSSDKVYIAGAAVSANDVIIVTAINPGAAGQSATTLVYDAFAVRGA